MSRVVVRGPDGRAELTLDMDDRPAVLLGRSPDPQALEPGQDAEGRPLEPVPVGGPSVSANHAAVWIDGDGVCVRDVGSKNGTWLLVPKLQTVRVGARDVTVQLAQSSFCNSASDEPAAPTWSTAPEYARAIASTTERWLRAHGVDVRLTVVPNPRDQDSAPSRLPLASGEALDLEPLGTTDARWSRLLEQLWRWTARQNSIFETEEKTRREGMILASRAIRAAHQEVVDAAERGATTLLLTGPPGAGKEMLAEVFHRHSGRSGPFIPINCALFNFNKELLRSELFGHETGAFSGAHRTVGAVERAQGGTLFLDEIGEISSEVQPMLLRFLDRREYERLGQYGRVQHADVRIVAATNRDLRQAAQAGGFREDLWWRLSVYEVPVPALGARWDDVQAYLETVRMGDGRSSLRQALAPEALELLRAHRWEGNFRELRCFAERLSRSTPVERIDAAECRRALDRSALRPSLAPVADPPESAPADWATLVSRAVKAFAEDHEREPATWDEQKEWYEEYLKPLLFFHLCGAQGLPDPLDDDSLSSLATKAATRLKADRGTARKQLSRYFRRFRA